MDADAQSEAMNGRAMLDHFHTHVHHNTSIFPSGAVWASLVVVEVWCWYSARADGWVSDCYPRWKLDRLRVSMRG